MGNQIRTTILLAVMTALILWIGQLFGGRQGMIIALLLAAGMNFFSYWYSDKIVLKMYRAQEASPQEANAFAQGRSSDAEVIYHSQRSAQRVRYRSQPGTCRSGGYPGIA